MSLVSHWTSSKSSKTKTSARPPSAIGVPVPVQALVNAEIGPAKGQIENAVSLNKLTFPVIIKPVRGRGSAGVKVVNSVEEAAEHIESHVGPKFGSKFLIEEYLSGRELAVTVMPPGTYETADGVHTRPPTGRFRRSSGLATTAA